MKETRSVSPYLHWHSDHYPYLFKTLVVVMLYILAHLYLVFLLSLATGLLHYCKTYPLAGLGGEAQGKLN